MQHLFLRPKNLYFAFGSSQKTSLCAQFSRENNFLHFNNPQPAAFTQPLQKHAIIEGTAALFNEIEKTCPNLHVIFFGKPCNHEQKRICKDYLQIGKCVSVSSNNYEEFRRVFYPNLIFFFGPHSEQNSAASVTFANVIGYCHTILPASANDLILYLEKSENYVVNGLFTDISQIKILEEYFQIKIVHFKYNRIDLPEHGQYFDKEYDLLNYLKDKCYYVPVQGKETPVNIMDCVGEGICPTLLFANLHTLEDRQYVESYIEETEGLILSIPEIQSINKRKNIPIASESRDKIKRLTNILYRDLARKQIVLIDFPWTLEEFIQLENQNRRISLYIDLSLPQNCRLEKEFTSSSYFLENNRWVRPNRNNSLCSELKPKIEYWIVNGPIGSGKSTVVKYLQSAFNFKPIDFETQLTTAKQKLANPDEGEELPVKKIFNYFKQMLEQNKGCTCVIDSLPYENNELGMWLQIIGVPNVINLEVEELEQIKRTRKKAEGDLAAEVSEEEKAKATESTNKNRQWIAKLCECAPSSKVFKLDYNSPQILAEQSINSILKPRVFLVQRNNTFLYQNLAVKYNMGFISLNKTRLRDCLTSVKACKSRDIIICHHGHEKKRLVSEDLFWIEKNIGNIRYLGIWSPENREVVEEKLVLEKPEVEEKPKPAEGAEGEEPPPPAEEGEQKKGMNIFDYEWSKPVCWKNLSQWFWKLKTNITEISSTPGECFKNFEQVLEKLDSCSRCNFYETIK